MIGNQGAPSVCVFECLAARGDRFGSLTRHTGSTMTRKRAPSQWVWMQTCRQEDIELLRKHLDPKGPLWSEWEYKLRGGNIIIYSPLIPWNKQRRPDPSRRYMAMHLRIVARQPG